MMERITEASPRIKARIAGGLWLMVIAGGVTAFVIRSPLIVRGDAAATAANILASESLFRLGFAADLIAGVCNGRVENEHDRSLSRLVDTDSIGHWSITINLFSEKPT